MISKKRIRAIKNYIGTIKEGEHFFVGMPVSSENLSKIAALGFSSELVAGECVLPAKKFGARSRFNAEGGYVRLRNLPKEKAYRRIQWTWQQWAPGGGTEEVTDFKTIEYLRYQRKTLPPPSLELTLIENDGGFWVVSPKLFYHPKEEKLNTHAINLMLEIFGSCHLLDENLSSAFPPKVVRLNWDILPKGQVPWNEIGDQIEKVVGTARPGNRPVIQNQVSEIRLHEPDFVAVGRNGFHGYMVFGFPQRNIFVLESIYTGNATYVFQENWQSLSQMTKAEIIGGGLVLERIVHKNDWSKKIRKLFSDHPVPGLTA